MGALGELIAPVALGIDRYDQGGSTPRIAEGAHNRFIRASALDGVAVMQACLCRVRLR